MPIAAGVVRDLGIAASRVLAACDMPAERRGATALDRTHHLQLLEAHMPAVGLAPGRTVIDANVPAALEQMSREAVTKRMQREHLAQPRGFRGFLEQPAELTRGQRLMITATWKQPALFWRDAGVVRGRPRLPPLPQQLQDLRWQHHVPVFLSLRLHDADDLLLAVDVARSQPHHLAGPQPATIGQR